jgi:hypothetical protein
MRSAGVGAAGRTAEAGDGVCESIGVFRIEVGGRDADARGALEAEPLARTDSPARNEKLANGRRLVAKRHPDAEARVAGRVDAA